MNEKPNSEIGKWAKVGEGMSRLHRRFRPPLGTRVNNVSCKNFAKTRIEKCFTTSMDMAGVQVPLGRRQFSRMLHENRLSPLSN